LLRPVRRRVLLAWACWLLSLALLWAQHQLAVLHPQALVFLALLLLTWAAGLGGALRGLVRLARGPVRLWAAAWTTAAAVPLVAWVVLGLYGHAQWRVRNVPRNVPFSLLKMTAASLMEAQANYLYPHRLETQRLVMFYDRGVDQPQRDAEAMDRFVAALERLTGKPLRAKIYWVRGPLLGQRCLAFYGLALGGNVSVPDWDAPGLVDRHELAHAVLYQHYGPDTDEPTLLTEGWAEAQSQAREALAAHALHARGGEGPPGGPRSWRGTGQSCLRALTGPGWYRQDSGPVYGVGGAFVDYLVRRHGAEKFLELYFGCAEATFADDVRRVYGVDLDTLESAFWADVERLAGGGRP
jgi:hypothetical protein